MEIVFIGTSSGAPTKSRNVSAIALIESTGSSWHLIDCGEGTQHQLLKSHLSLNSLSTVFLTHLHGDHCYGLPGLLASAGLNGRKSPLRIVAPEGTKGWIEVTQRISELYLPYVLEFIVPEKVSDCRFDQFSVSSIPLSHRIACFGYAFTETNIRPTLSIEKLYDVGIPKGPMWGQIQAGKDVEFNRVVYRAKEFYEKARRPRKILICGDNDMPNLLENECHDCDVLVHESTYSEHMSERAKSVGHSYSRLVAQFAEGVGMPNLVLTHVSARYSENPSVLKDEARSEFSGNLYLANDFDHFRLSTSGLFELM